MSGGEFLPPMPGFVGKHHETMDRTELLEFVEMLVTISRDRGLAITLALDHLRRGEHEWAEDILNRSV